MASAYLSVWEKVVPHVSPWCQTLQFFPMCHWCLSNAAPVLELRGGECKSVCGFFKWNCLGLQKFFYPLTSIHWFLQPEVMGTYLPDTGNLAGGLVWGWISFSQDIPPKFLSTTCGCGTSLFCISVPPATLDGCGFFNSVVVRLPFDLTSDGSEWWLFYN